MPWLVLSVLPNLDLQLAVVGQQVSIVPAYDVRVEELRAEHPNLGRFLASFRNSHGRVVAPAVMLLDDAAPPSRRTGEAMVGMRNALSIATVTRQTALELLYPGAHRILFSDPFEFYPWNLDRHFDRMVSITPALMAIHQVDEFSGQPSPSSPVHTLTGVGLDRGLLPQLLVHWDAAYARATQTRFHTALFRSLNMANAAMRMPATSAATIFDYGRQCALWISAFEILAHHDAGRNKADLQAVFDLFDRKRFLTRGVNARRYRVTYRGQTRSVSIVHKLYKQLYDVRNHFLHGNPVTARTLRLPVSGRLIGAFAPLLYRIALRAYLDLRFVDEHETLGGRGPVEAALRQYRFEEPQWDAEQAILLARTAPIDED